MRTVRRKLTKATESYREGVIPWCTCPLGKKPGYAYNRELDMWVEANCRKPTRMYWEKHANRQP